MIVKCCGLIMEFTANIGAAQNIFFVPWEYRMALGICTFAFFLNEASLNFRGGLKTQLSGDSTSSMTRADLPSFNVDAAYSC